MVIASAIKLNNGSVYVGKRHSDCYEHVFDINVKAGMDYETAKQLHFNCEQGFITDKLVFMSRARAWDEGYVCKQFVDTEYNELYSEDLW